MAHGVYRTEDDWVQVTYGGRHSFEISRKRYEEKGYQPPFDQLPLERGAEGAKQKLPRHAEQF